MNLVQSCSADTVADIRSSITALQAQIQEILENFNQRQHSVTSNKEMDLVSNPPPPSPNEPPTQVEIATTADQDLESSINSIEEFMSSETLPTPHPLNSQ